jgi:predicted nucleic-acid-binding Zn-ribbon protein|nr:MAG TPA: antitoxin [Caudoviricetes sp.]
MKAICTRCGGTNIACEAIVNPNTGKIIDYLDESFMHANCGDCKEEVVITDVDRVKKDIDSMFFKFVKKNGKEPEKDNALCV